MSGEAQATEYMAAPQKKKRGSFGPLIAIVTVGVMDQEPTHIAVAHLGEGDLLAGGGHKRYVGDSRKWPHYLGRMGKSGPAEA
jgi:hypothetical protein